MVAKFAGSRGTRCVDKVGRVVMTSFEYAPERAHFFDLHPPQSMPPTLAQPRNPISAARVRRLPGVLVAGPVRLPLLLTQPTVWGPRLK